MNINYGRIEPIRKQLTHSMNPKLVPKPHSTRQTLWTLMHFRKLASMCSIQWNSRYAGRPRPCTTWPHPTKHTQAQTEVEKSIHSICITVPTHRSAASLKALKINQRINPLIIKSSATFAIDIQDTQWRCENKWFAIKLEYIEMAQNDMIWKKKLAELNGMEQSELKLILINIKWN